MRQSLGALNRDIEQMRAAGEFVSIAKYLLRSKQAGLLGALGEAQQARASPRILDALKTRAAVGAGGLASGSSWGSELGDWKLVVGGFVNALSSVGAFDAMLSAMRVVPLASTVGSISTVATGYVVGEAGAKQISKLALTNGQLEPRKAHCVIVITEELARASGPEANALIGREWRNAVALATDAEFVSIITAGISVATSVGSTPVSVRTDLAGLLAAVPTDQTSKLFLLTTPAICKTWSMMGATSTNASPAFESVTPQGGSISGIPVIASDGVSAGLVVLADASGIAAGSGDIILDNLRHTTVQLESTPDSPPSAATNYLSLWQMNMTGLRIERWWGVERLRSSAVAVVQNSNSYQSGFSPP